MSGQSPIHFIPIVTTMVASGFAFVVFSRYRLRGGPHLLWWGIGMITYAAGTFTESWTTLFGWNEQVFRLWYITGALLGGAPLAQGTAYLLWPRRTANRVATVLVTVIVVASVAVLLAPINLALVEPHRLSGKIFAAQWVRAFSPFINTYAATVLVGGAIWSALRYWRAQGREALRRVVGNILIAVGGILPGIGGSFTRFGYVEVLYVTELIGLLLIFAGYRCITGDAKPTIHRAAAVEA
ncbi:MAG: hypothetical protein V4503_03950 [Gemmatimonadota bacterium]